MKRIIFLDVDGVLNHHKTAHRVDPETADDGPGFRGMSPECVKNLQTLIEKSGALVVMSSTWRKEPYGLDNTERVARRQGFKGPRWIDITPTLYQGFRELERGHEIQAWLDEHLKKDEPSEFIIIDDDSDMVHLLPRLVQTDPYNGGLTEAKVAEALKLFGIET